MDPREEEELGSRRRRAEMQGEEGLKPREIQGGDSWLLAAGVGAQRDKGQQGTWADSDRVSNLMAHLCHRRHSYRTGQDITNCGTCRDCACIIYR